MSKTKLYKAFGLVIESEFTIPQITELHNVQSDVRIVRAQLRGIVDPDAPTTAEGGCIVPTLTDTLFRVTNGNLIEADVCDGDTDSNVAVYLTGSCMGAILVQRGYMLLHGSCVTLAGMLPMALAVRENGKQCADTICDLIINYLEEQSHD